MLVLPLRASLAEVNGAADVPTVPWSEFVVVDAAAEWAKNVVFITRDFPCTRGRRS